MDALFGSAMPLAVRFFIAFLVVLALIGLTAWLVRRFGANRLGSAARGRQPRLAVIDAASVDGRRRLVLIRRDNIEHLLMIGGPTDVVIEPNIVRAAAAATREPPRLATTPEPVMRVTPPPIESAWPPPPVSEPAPPPPRAPRAPATEEAWHAPEPAVRVRQSDSLTGLAAELSSKLAKPTDVAPQPAPRERDDVPRTTAAPPMAPEPPAAPPQDHNLAEMAQQLEAALRRAPAPEGRPPVTDALAVPPPPPAAARPIARESKPRLEPKFEAPKFEAPKFEAPKFEPPKPEQPKFEPPKPEPKFEAPKFELPKAEPKFEAPKFEPPKQEPKFEPPRFELAKPEPKFEPPKFEAPKHEPPKFEGQPAPRPETRAEPKPEAPMAPEKTLYDNLEEEMASLLGRPSDKS